ncbi:helix-turn-helix transcriptional regulator [Gallionella capsiferriformans]|uniref:Prophage CP4-57 regulatory n=1 Tax=Gallionella capsiferriformans (strain ES-2) TaxID=395494 RepID=D9SII5_GALCS|nr:Prophage CP4-57 regulatory [Gallionella capsiferriformans ES-2]
MLWNIHQVVAAVTLSKSTVYRLIKDGKFPQPVRISYKRVGWLKADIDSFVASLQHLA